MTKFRLFAALGAVLLCIAAEPPAVHVSAKSGAPPGIAVGASDSEGLDSLDITCAQVDLSYHTQLSGVTDFRRSFTLTDLFPGTAEWKYPVRLDVTVRNTRGATATSRFFLGTHNNKGR